MIEIDLSAKQAIAAFEELDRRLSDQTELMGNIGNYLAVATKDRINAGGPAPDGQPWAPKSEVTIANYIRKRERINRKPLTHLGELFRRIAYEHGRDYAAVGANTVYAAVMQFGAAKGAHGTTKRGAPIPWGNIPARPYLGISDDDERNIIEEVEEYLVGAFIKHAG